MAFFSIHSRIFSSTNYKVPHRIMWRNGEAVVKRVIPLDRLTDRKALLEASNDPSPQMMYLGHLNTLRWSWKFGPFSDISN